MKKYAIPVLLTAIVLSFQNCGDVTFSPIDGLTPLDTNPRCDSENLEDCIRSINATITVQQPTNKVDIVFVVDNSGSMEPELKELGNKFSTFVASLNMQNLDWRVAVTTTDVRTNNNLRGNDGKFFNFGNNDGPTWIDKDTVYTVNRQNKNAAQLFKDLLDSINDNGSGDERGIYAINRVLIRNKNSFRADAALATVILSDEDERSTGGLPGSNQSKTLEDYDYPNSVFNTLAAQGFAGKIYTNHSIIIRPAVPALNFPVADQACYDAQKEHSDVWYGTHYAELTRLTKGILGDICASDYGTQLSFIGQNIGQSLGSVALECEPVNSAGQRITNAASIIQSISPAMPTTPSLAGNKLNFNPALPPGTVLRLNYYCFR